METERFIYNVTRLVKLSPGEIELVLDKTIFRRFRRGELICREGEINRYTNFINSGSIRVYHIDPDGQEHVVQLGIPNWWVSDYASFITQKPGLLYCEALEPVETFSISYDALEELYSLVPPMERFFRLLIQKAYAAFQNRVLQSLSMDAEERYLRFRNMYPDIDQQIAQKHIASYLGMSAEFLSKIKKRIVLKERKGR
jgi:CRP-like cAMP-binding protein